jgi:hypothetical protein
VELADRALELIRADSTLDPAGTLEAAKGGRGRAWGVGSASIPSGVSANVCSCPTPIKEERSLSRQLP